ncbi:hypothetical protein CR513_04920, partial [Mucuna pruriens]
MTLLDRDSLDGPRSPSNITKIGWQKDFSGDTAVEGVLLRLIVEDPLTLSKLFDKARIFQQMLNKAIFHKARSKDNLLVEHLFALFHMMTGQKFNLPSLLLVQLKNINAKGKKQNQVTHVALLNKIVWIIRVTKCSSSLTHTLSLSEATPRLGVTDVIKDTIDLASKGPMSKSTTPFVRTTKAVAKTQKKLILLAEPKKEEENDNDDVALLISRMAKWKTHIIYINQVHIPCQTRGDDCLSSQLARDGCSAIVVGLIHLLPKSYELQSGLIYLLPKFHDLAGEDSHKHLKEFHVVCSTMRSQGIPEDYIKMKVFPFSLDGAAKDWLYL